MKRKSTVKMKHGQSIIVQRVLVEVDSSIVLWFNVQHTHIAVTCTNLRMNAVQNVVVSSNIEKKRQHR